MPSAAPAVPDVDLTLTLSTASGEARTLDLATRAIVVAVVPTPRFGREAEVLAGVAAAVEAGADVVEVPAESKLLGPAVREADIPVAATVTTHESARQAVAAGAALLMVPRDAIAAVLANEDSADDVADSDGANNDNDTTRTDDTDFDDIDLRDSGADVDGSSSDLDSSGSGADRASARSDGRLGDVPPSSEWTLATVVDTAAAGRDAVVERPDRPVVLDVTGLAGADAVSEESLALSVGVRLIRTNDVRRTRRVVEVMAHLLAARR